MISISEMTDRFALPTAFVIGGVLILQNLDALASFDQHSGVRLHSWFKRKLGADSMLNREIYSVGTPSGLHRSKAVLRVCAIFSVIFGLAMIVLEFALFTKSARVR